MTAIAKENSLIKYLLFNFYKKTFSLFKSKKNYPFTLLRVLELNKNSHKFEIQITNMRRKFFISANSLKNKNYLIRNFSPYDVYIITTYLCKEELSPKKELKDFDLLNGAIKFLNIKDSSYTSCKFNDISKEIIDDLNPKDARVIGFMENEYSRIIEAQKLQKLRNQKQ